MQPRVPQSSGLFATVGSGLFRRAAFLLGDERVAADAAETLFVRFMVYAQGPALSPRARWAWIYRVVTSHCVRRLLEDAAPHAGASDLAASPRAELLQRLRQFDEATQNIAVLATWDGLPVAEIAEILGMPMTLVRQRLDKITTGQTAPSLASAGRDADAHADDVHPSSFALDVGRAAHEDHLSRCDRCRAAVDRGERLVEHFSRDLSPAATPRVAAAIRIERARQSSGPRWKRLFWMTGALVLVSALALFVARPRRPDRLDAPYGGPKGASRQKASGLQISVRRREEVRALEPGAALLRGDRLHFRVRSERARYLELRVRPPVRAAAAIGRDVRVFPEAGVESVLVRPGQALDRDYVVDQPPASEHTSAGTLWIFALFADHPFPLDRQPGPDVEVVPVRVDTDL